MNYNHLTIEERCCIRKYYNDGKSFREIAELVGRNVLKPAAIIITVFNSIPLFLALMILFMVPC